MNAKSLIFKRRISALGVCIFVVIACFKLSFKIVKWSIKSLHGFIIYVRNFRILVKSGYSHKELQDLIHGMTGYEFEKFCYLIFKEMGYSVKLTQKSADGGKDIILYDEEEGYTYVECKRWNDDFKVGRPELQKLVGSAVGDDIPNMLFVTTGTYNTNAKEYAKKIDNLELWTLDNLMYQIFKIEAKRIPFIIAKTFNNANTRIIRVKPIRQQM